MLKRTKFARNLFLHQLNWALVINQPACSGMAKAVKSRPRSRIQYFNAKKQTVAITSTGNWNTRKPETVTILSLDWGLVQLLDCHTMYLGVKR